MSVGGERDGGLQPERTRLAWRRTVLAMTVVALLLGRYTVVHQHGAVGALGAAGALAIWLASLVIGHRRIVALAARRPKPAKGAMPLIALAAIAFAALGVALVITSIL